MADWEQLRELARQVAAPDFDTLARTARARHRRARAALGVLASLVLIGGGVGIAALDDPDRDPVQPAQDPTEGPTDLPGEVSALPGYDPGKDFATLAAGRYRVPLDDDLAFEVEVPDESYAHSDGLYLSNGPVVLKTELAGEYYGVPDDACRDRRIEPAGPTVDDLVTAIRDTRPYQVSEPEDVRLDGHPGTYLEVRIPAGYDATSCRDGQVALPGNPSTYNNLEPGYVGYWWILDVDGQRVVIQQDCVCSTSRLDRAAAIPRSITFTSAP